MTRQNSAVAISLDVSDMTFSIDMVDGEGIEGYTEDDTVIVASDCGTVFLIGTEDDILRIATNLAQEIYCYQQKRKREFL